MCCIRAELGKLSSQTSKLVTIRGSKLPVNTRAANEVSWRYHNHGESSYKGCLLVESPYKCFHILEFNKKLFYRREIGVKIITDEQPVGYDLCFWVPILRLLTLFRSPFSIVSQPEGGLHTGLLCDCETFNFASSSQHTPLPLQPRQNTETLKP